MAVKRDFNDFLSGFKSAKFKNLWPAQKYVLEKYADQFAEKADVAIELPTGAGKTLILLLIAEAWRQEGKKVAILSANKTLARQMEKEAKLLKIPAVLMEGRGVDIASKDKRDYHRANKIAVMNYWVYFNQNPVLDNADLLIMDDAHLAEHCLHTLYSVEISRYEHANLFKSLLEELVIHFPEYTVMQDALSESAVSVTPPELLSFLDQIQIASRVREIVDSSPLLETDADLKYRWKRLRNYLNEVNIYMSLNSIWIRPYVYPLISNSHYNDATQRLYMSATIGDPSDLCRRLGTRKINKIPVPAEHSAVTSGRRLIVINRIEEKDIPERLQAAILAVMKKLPKSVWICTSRVKAEKLRQAVTEWLNKNGMVGHDTWLLSSLGDEIDQFKKSKKGHLFVAGRFDGMDFSGDECRLVILATLPRAINVQEEFLCAYLRDGGFMKRRLNQRIVQALGRCNRSADDYAVYILADRRFATHFGLESNKLGVPKNVITEIDMAEDMAEIDVDDLQQKIDKFMSGNFKDYDATFKKMLSGVPVIKDTSPLADVAEDEVLGWAAMFPSQNFNIAAQKFETCQKKALEANIVELGAYYGWCWSKARYLESLQGVAGAKEDALSILEKAISRGGASSWFNRMKSSLNRARAKPVKQSILSEEYALTLIRSFDNLLEELGTKGNRFEKWCGQLTEELESKHHDKYSQGIDKLGKLLGYDASRPKHASATDCRWRGIFGNDKEVLTIELKIEDEPDGNIVAKDIGQAHNQITRAKSEYESLGYTIRGLIITHLPALKSDAESSAGNIRVVAKSTVLDLWKHVKQLLTLYRASWSADDIKARQLSAASIRTKLPSSGWLIKALNVDERFVSTTALLKEWK
mgnify:CR=1 FL=1